MYPGTWKRRFLTESLRLDLMVHDQALHDSSHDCKLLIAKEMVGASGFEPPSSWSRTVGQIH